LFGLLSCSITSCSKDRKPTYQELLEEHEEKESTDNFVMFVIGLVTVIVIYRKIKKDR
jgi:hypothetical protein